MDRLRPEPFNRFPENCEMFTPNHLKIMSGMAFGLTDKEIAGEIVREETTVHNEMTVMSGAFVEPGRRATVKAFVYAVQNGMVPGLDQLPDFTPGFLGEKEKFVLAYMVEGFQNILIQTSLKMKTQELKKVKAVICEKHGTQVVVY